MLAVTVFPLEFVVCQLSPTFLPDGRTPQLSTLVPVFNVHSVSPFMVQVPDEPLLVVYRPLALNETEKDEPGAGVTCNCLPVNSTPIVSLAKTGVAAKAHESAAILAQSFVIFIVGLILPSITGTTTIESLCAVNSQVIDNFVLILI
jgi:hypothetical protein